MKMLCKSQEQLDRMNEAKERLGDKVCDLLFQARGWACRWLPDNKEHNSVMKKFIDDVDKELGIEEKDK